MRIEEFLQRTKGRMIVSCQALENEPLYGADIMARMAVAVVQGGAAGVRCGYGQDIHAIKKAVDVPVIGLVKRNYDDSPIFITPTLREIEEVVQAGADVVAFDCTSRLHPGAMDTATLIHAAKAAFGQDILMMADISTHQEGVAAADAGMDMVSTTLSGYTPYSPQLEGPDFDLMESLAATLVVPVLAEGRIWTPEEAARAMDTGVHAIIVGTAITRPKDITERFLQKMGEDRHHLL